MTDEKIVDLYWRRDESAITETQLKYEKYLTKVAYNILYDLEDSRESVNDTYLRAWKAIPPHKPQVLSTFLAKITRRVSIDMVRRRTRNKRVPSEYTSSLAELDECIAGQCYNFREVMTYEDKNDNEKAKQLYESLGVAIQISIAFPFIKDGKVKGAIEIVNPTEKVDEGGQTAFGSLCSLILPI